MGKLTVDIYLCVLFASIALGLIFLIQNKKYSYLHTLPVFLIYIYIVEQFAGYLKNNYKPNAWVYNYSSVVEVGYYMWLVSKMYVSKKYFKTATIVNALIIVASLTNIIFFQGKKGFHTITFGVSSILVIITCIYYYYQLFVYPSISTLYKQMEFWVVTAIMFDFTCGFPIFCLNNIYYNAVSKKIWPIIIDFNDIINIIFYSLFITAFLCKIKKFWR